MRAVTIIMSLIVSLAAGCGGVTDTPSREGSMDARTAREAATLAAQTIVHTALLARPAADLKAILEQGRPFPNCPTMSVDVRGNTLDLSLNYPDGGCTVDDVPGLMASGVLAGNYLPGVHEFSFQAAQLTVAGRAAIEGSYFGRISYREDVQAFAVTFDLRLSDGTIVSGSATVEIDLSGDSIRIAYANGKVTTGTESSTIRLTDATMNLAAGAPLVPISGEFDLWESDTDALGTADWSGRFD